MNPIRETLRFIANEDYYVGLCSTTPVPHIDDWTVGSSFHVSILLISPDRREGDEYAMFEVLEWSTVELLGPYSPDIYHPWRDL